MPRYVAPMAPVVRPARGNRTILSLWQGGAVLGTEDFGQLRQAVDEQVRGVGVQFQVAKAVGHAAGPDTGASAGLDVHVGIAHDHGGLRRHSSLLEDGKNADRVRLLALEAVAPVHTLEKS